MAIVLICDGIAKAAIEKLKLKKIEIEESPALKEDELIAKLQKDPIEILLIRSSTNVTAKVLQAGKMKLKLIGRAGVGVDNVDVPAATAAGVKVMNTPGANSNAVVELTLGLMLCMARPIVQADNSMKAGKWEKKTLKGTELAGKTLGLVGVGRIGLEVARRARAFGMSVIGFDPYLDAARVGSDCKLVKSLDEIYAAADYISIHSPLTKETRNLVGDAAFAKMKKGVRIVNAARGGIVDETALLKQLDGGKVAGAALDVYGEEPPKNEALIRHPKLILMPHIGAATDESQDNCAHMIADQVIAYLDSGKLINTVN